MSLAERLVTRLASVANRKPTSRRNFLAAATLGGTALAVNPWGYLTRPQSAYASLCGTDAACSDGYSVMCCSINNGSNTCPPGTFAGGWWKADRSSYCGGGARYYIDCNAKPDTHFRCHCHKGSCDQRRVACNVFRYGQCNTQIVGITAVVCRQISCRPPWEIHPNCGRSSMTDNNTAGQTAPCLNHDNTFPALRTFPAAPATLEAGHSLRGGDRLTSPDRHTTALFTDKGNLIVINERGVVWASGTANQAVGGRALLRHTGALVVLDGNGVVKWSSHSGGPGGTHPVLRMRNDGQLVIYHNGNVVWSSHTRTP